MEEICFFRGFSLGSLIVASGILISVAGTVSTTVRLASVLVILIIELEIWVLVILVVAVMVVFVASLVSCSVFGSEGATFSEDLIIFGIASAAFGVAAC